jgi:hypothetical protein
MRRPGYFARGYGGVIRDNGWPLYECDHQHDTDREARACADRAWGRFQKEGVLPEGWHAYIATQ